MKKTRKPAIIKIQASQSSGDSRVLIYDKEYKEDGGHRGHLYEGPMLPVILKMMGGRPKAFFWGTLHRSGQAFSWEIGGEAPWQDW